MTDKLAINSDLPLNQMITDLSQRLASLDSSELSPGNAQTAATLAPASTSEPLTEDDAGFLPCELQLALNLDRLRQTHRLEGGRIHSMTYVLLPGVDPHAVEAALIDEPWTWWKHGKISDWTRREDGGCKFVLSPVWPYVPSKVGIELEPRTTDQRLTQWGAVPFASYSARFFADFEGPGGYDVLTLPDGAALRSRWDGVARVGVKKLMPLPMILGMHLGAEAGTVGFPFPKGTGFPGLIEKLGAASADEAE